MSIPWLQLSICSGISISFFPPLPSPFESFCGEHRQSVIGVFNEWMRDRFWDWQREARSNEKHSFFLTLQLWFVRSLCKCVRRTVIIILLFVGLIIRCHCCCRTSRLPVFDYSACVCERCGIQHHASAISIKLFPKDHYSASYHKNVAVLMTS